MRQDNDFNQWRRVHRAKRLAAVFRHHSRALFSHGFVPHPYNGMLDIDIAAALNRFDKDICNFKDYVLALESVFFFV